MKKIITSILAAAMLLAVCLGSFTGCVQQQNPAIDFVIPEGGFDTETPVTITFYHSMGAALQGILDDAIAAFKEKYPNITVEHSSYGDYNGVRDQIKNEIAVGNPPNIAYCYPDHVAFYNISGAVQPLDVFMDSEYAFTEQEIADFGANYFEDGSAYADGKLYSLSMSKSTEVLYYNKTFFEANADKGLKVPTTWDEMEEACRIIREIDKTSIPLGYDSEANWFITMCEQSDSDYTSASGENFLFDNDTNKAFVKRFRTWYENKWVTTQELNGGAYTSAMFTGKSSSGDTVSTRCYMCIGSTGGATYQQPTVTNGVAEFEVGIVPIPQLDKENPKVIAQGPSLCIFKNANPQEVIASWLFAKFLTTDVEFQARVSMNNGYAPVTQAVMKNETYAAYLEKADTLNITAYAVKVALEQSDALYESPAFNGSSVARDQVALLMQKCLAGETNDVDAFIAQAFKDAVAECKYQSGQ